MKKSRDKKENVLVIGDLHEPFSHPDTYPFINAVAKAVGPTRIVLAGDEVDSHCLSRFDKDPDGFSAGDELATAIKGLQPLYTKFPRADVCKSNHTDRPFRLAYRMGLPKAYIRSFREFLQAPKGWNWHDHLEIDGVRYEHGEGFTGRNGAVNCALGNMRSTVIGHIHSFAGVQWAANPRHLVFGFNVGCLIDKDAYAFAYGKAMKNKPIIGLGVVERGQPRFIPMEMSKHGRWTGRL